MSLKEDQVSVRSRESVGSQRMMSDTVSTESEAQQRRTACAWAQGERAVEGERERIQASVVAQSMEGDGMDSLWRVMSVIEGRQGTHQEAKEVRDRVVATVEERWKLKEPLLRGEPGWQVYIQKMVKGRRKGGLPEAEAWAMGGGYRITVYGETTHGAGYRKIQEYGEENSIWAGILWKRTTVYEVVWEQEGEGRGRAAGDEGDKEKCRGAAARANVGRGRGHSLTSSDSRPSTWGAGSVGSTEGNVVQQ